MPTNFVGWVSTLARTHARSLAAGAVREGLTRVEAIDAVQEAFTTLLRLPQARELSLDDEGASALMAVLVRNAARNIRRRRLRHPSEPVEGALEVPADAPSVDCLLAATEEHVALLGCVNQLAETQQLVVRMRVLEELSPEEVARALGLTRGHIAVLLHRAKRALIDCIEREQAEDACAT